MGDIDGTVEVREYMSIFIPLFAGFVVIYPYWDFSSTVLVKGAPADYLPYSILLSQGDDPRLPRIASLEWCAWLGTWSDWDGRYAGV